MKKIFYAFFLTIACFMLAGCGGKRSLTPEELKEEIARSVPKEGFEPFLEISPGLSVKSYSKKRPYDLFAPGQYGKPVEEEKAVSATAPVKTDGAEKTSPGSPVLQEDEQIALAPKTAPSETTGQLPEEKKAVTGKLEVQSSQQLAILDNWNGECLVYRITWNGITFGKGMLACKETSNSYGNIYHTIGLSIPEPRAAGFGIGLYRMDAFIDKKSLLPHYFYQYSKNKNKEDILEIRFDWNKKFYRTKYRKFDSGRLYSTKEQTVDLKDVAYDSISVFYKVRTLDLDKKTSYKIPIAFREIWDLTIRTAGKKTENIPCIGRKEVYVLKPQAQSNEGFFTKGAMDLWITADNRRLPVNLEGKVSLGKAKMMLISATKLAPDVTFDTGTITEILSRCN